MRFTAVLPVALAVVPAAVSATGQVGFAVGTRNADNSCKSTSDYLADFAALQGLTKLVRGYDTSDCNFAQNILPACQQTGFQVMLGIWPDADSSWEAGRAALQAVVTQYGSSLGSLVYAVTVGSETQYRHSLPPSNPPAVTIDANTLNGFINNITQLVPNSVKVGTADSYTSYVAGLMDPIIQNSNVKILLSNAFPYWQGQTINNSTASFFDDTAQALGRIQSVSGSTSSIQFMVGETGWPTAGQNYQAAAVGVSQAQQYWKGAVCGMRDWGVDVFVFEAFDEPNKQPSQGLDGQYYDETHWGTFDVNRNSKFDTSC